VVLHALAVLGAGGLLIGPAPGGRGEQPPAQPSPLDQLDPSKIPAEVRFDKQPKELVAVFGKPLSTGTYNSVAFSPDGRTLASCRNDSEGGNVAVLWDTGTGREVAVLRGHDRHLRSVAFSPDGKTLASGAGGNLPDRFINEGEIKLWDVSGKEPKLKADFPNHQELLLSVAFSPDGKTLASGSSTAVRLWDVGGAKPAEKVKFSIAIQALHVVAFSPDAKSLATPEALWDLGDEKPVKRAALYPSVYRDNAASCVAFSPDGKALAVGTGDNRTVLVWKLGQAELKEPLELKEAGPQVQSVAFAPEGRQLAASTGNGLVVLWDRDGKRLREWKLQTQPIKSVAFAPDGRHLAAATEHGLVYILRLPD
jgi:WD40 repeat protein